MKIFREKPLREDGELIYFQLPNNTVIDREKKGWKKYYDENKKCEEAIYGRKSDMDFNFGYALNYLDVNGKLVLDMGVGIGWTSEEIAKKGGEVYAVDLLDCTELVARKGFKKVFCDMNNLPFQDEVFDIVWFNGALHHSYNLFNALKEAKRVCKVGGIIVLTAEPIGRIYCPLADKFIKYKYDLNEQNPLLLSYNRYFKKLNLKVKDRGKYSKADNIHNINWWTHFNGGVLNVILRRGGL